MTVDEMKLEIWNIDFEASMNQNYHRKKRAQWETKDRTIKFIVAGLAVGSLVAAIVGLVKLSIFSALAMTGASIVFGVLSSAAAIWLNVKDYSTPMSIHEALYRSWTLLIGDVRDLHGETEKLSPQLKNSPIELVEQWRLIKSHMARVESGEPEEEDEQLLTRCYEDENQRRWGVRAYQDVLAKKEKGFEPNWPGLKPEQIVPISH